MLDPVTAEYLPAKQSSQAALPVTALYLPAMQRVQLPAGPVDDGGQATATHSNGIVPTLTYPKLHVQFVTEVLLVGAELNCGQVVQVAFPLVSL